MENVSISLNADPVLSRSYVTLPKIEPYVDLKDPVDEFVRRMNRLCNIVRMPSVTGKLIQLGIQIGSTSMGKLKENLYLNQVPHNRFVRKYFYDMASRAVLDAVTLCSQGKISNRMKMRIKFPELNPSMDSYRIGTLLELARSVTMTLVEQNLRVKLCVQGSMGVGIFTGLPKQLVGVMTLLQRMDWQSELGEENEGMIGNYVNFGAVGKRFVSNDKDHQDDVIIILCPQSMVGTDSSIIGPLSEMVDAAGDRPVLLINPDLTDKVSSQGQQNIRGRKQRLEFADSFQTIFHFRNLYVSGTSYFPILGAVSKIGPTYPWIAYQRRDRVNNDGEVYVPTLSSEQKLDGQTIMSTFES